MATQLEQAKIQVKETTPVLTVISPVAMPVKPSKPRKMMLLAAFTFLGLVAGSGYVLVRPMVAEFLGSMRDEERKRKEGNA